MAANDIGCVDMSLLKEVGERMKDKKVATIRLNSVVGEKLTTISMYKAPDQKGGNDWLSPSICSAHLFKGRI